MVAPQPGQYARFDILSFRTCRPRILAPQPQQYARFDILSFRTCRPPIFDRAVVQSKSTRRLFAACLDWHAPEVEDFTFSFIRAISFGKGSEHALDRLLSFSRGPRAPLQHVFLFGPLLDDDDDNGDDKMVTTAQLTVTALGKSDPCSTLLNSPASMRGLSTHFPRRRPNASVCHTLTGEWAPGQRLPTVHIHCGG